MRSKNQQIARFLLALMALATGIAIAAIDQLTRIYPILIGLHTDVSYSVDDSQLLSVGHVALVVTPVGSHSPCHSLGVRSPNSHKSE